MYRTAAALALAAATVAVIAFCAPRAASDERDGGAIPAGPLATLHTNHGDIVLRLRSDVAPTSVERFVRQARRGMYDGVRFDYVTPDAAAAGEFMADGAPNTSPALFIRRHGERQNPLALAPGAVSFTVVDDRFEGGDLYFALAPHPTGMTAYLVYFAQMESGFEALSHTYDALSACASPADLVIIHGVTLGTY